MSRRLSDFVLNYAVILVTVLIFVLISPMLLAFGLLDCYENRFDKRFKGKLERQGTHS